MVEVHGAGDFNCRRERGRGGMSGRRGGWYARTRSIDRPITFRQLQEPASSDREEEMNGWRIRGKSTRGRLGTARRSATSEAEVQVAVTHYADIGIFTTCARQYSYMKNGYQQFKCRSTRFMLARRSTSSTLRRHWPLSGSLSACDPGLSIQQESNWVFNILPSKLVKKLFLSYCNL